MPLDGQVVRPGIITSQFPENKLVFDNCIFRENDYGRISVQVSAVVAVGNFTLAPHDIELICPPLHIFPANWMGRQY